MHKKIRLIQRKKSNVLKGAPLRVAVSIEQRYAEKLLHAINIMTSATEREVRELFEADNYAGDYAMDANIGAQARILMNKLSERFEAMFARIAQPITESMIDQVDDNSAATLKSSLFEIADNMQFSTKLFTSELREVLSASVAENVALIKRVPAQYLDQITGSVMRSIQSGSGLADLVPELAKQKVSVRNWAQNVAMDQTRKAYGGINKGRMLALGVKKYEWVHSGGSNHPRKYHKDVLNGQIFSLDDPPVIDERTGARGIPGTAIFCRCTMRPIVSFDD